MTVVSTLINIDFYKTTSGALSRYARASNRGDRTTSEATPRE